MKEFAHNALEFIENETQYFNPNQFHEAEIKALQYLSYLEWRKGKISVPEYWPSTKAFVEAGVTNLLQSIVEGLSFQANKTTSGKYFFAILKQEHIKNPYLVEEAAELGINGFVFSATPNAAYNQHVEQMLIRASEDTHLEIQQMVDCRLKFAYVEGLAPLNYIEFAKNNEQEIIHFKKLSAELSLEKNVIPYLGDVKHLLPGTKISFTDGLGKVRKCKVLTVSETGFSIQIKKQTTLIGNTTVRFLSDQDVFLDEITLGEIKQPLTNLKMFQDDVLELVNEITEHNQILVPIAKTKELIIGSRVSGSSWNGIITDVADEKVAIKILSPKAQIALFDRLKIEGYQPENKIKAPKEAHFLITNTVMENNCFFQIDTIENELLSKQIIQCKKQGFLGIILPSGLSATILQQVLMLAKVVELRSFVNVTYKETKNRFHCLALSEADGIILEDFKKIDAQLERLEANF